MYTVTFSNEELEEIWKQIRTRPFDWVYLVANPC